MQKNNFTYKKIIENRKKIIAHIKKFLHIEKNNCTYKKIIENRKKIIENRKK